jgi:hypothetical protein
MEFCPLYVCVVFFCVGRGLVTSYLVFVEKLIRKPNNGGQHPHRAVKAVVNE